MVGGAPARGRASNTSAWSRRPGTSAAPGTGTAIPAPCATSRATATCRCSKSWATCPSTNTASRRKSWSTAAASRGTSGSTTTPCCRPSHRAALGRGGRRAGSSAPTAATASRRGIVAMANGPLHAPEAAGHPGHRELRGPHLPHQPLGLCLYRRRLDGGPDRPGGQAGGDHRHRGHGDPVRARTWASGRKHLYVFQRTPSSVDVRNNAPTDPDWAGLARARLAAAAAGQLQHPGGRRLPGRGPGPRRLDRHLPRPTARPRRRRPGGWAPAHGRRARPADGTGRLPQDERGARAGGRRS